MYVQVHCRYRQCTYKYTTRTLHTLHLLYLVRTIRAKGPSRTFTAHLSANCLQQEYRHHCCRREVQPQLDRPPCIYCTPAGHTAPPSPTQQSLLQRTAPTTRCAALRGYLVSERRVPGLGHTNHLLDYLVRDCSHSRVDRARARYADGKKKGLVLGYVRVYGQPWCAVVMVMRDAFC